MYAVWAIEGDVKHGMSGKESARGVVERIVPWKWSYMDIVTGVCSSIAAYAAEREEVRECVEVLKSLFGIGQQCGCANANSKRKAKEEKRRTAKERQRKRRSEERKRWKGD